MKAVRSAAERSVKVSDSTIIELFFARDESAISKTAEKYGRKLFGISENITGDPEDAEECVNDTYLAAWNSIPPTRPDNYYAYICRIVRNISLDRADRKKAGKRSAEVVPFSAELESVLADTEADPGRAEELPALLDGFLRGLDEDTRLMFLRRYFYGDSTSRISEMTGVGENVIYARLFRARKRLKKLLVKEGFCR